MAWPKGKPRKEVESSEHLIQQAPFDPFEHGERSVEIVDGPLIGSKADTEKFMNEIVTVVVHDTTDKNAVPIVSVSVNGRTQNFIRGQAQRCRRVYVERLARAKETSYTQSLDPGLLDGVNKMHPHAALSYPFSVIDDANPKGQDWLRKVLAEVA